MIFIKQPIIPFSLIVTISTKETIKAMRNEVSDSRSAVKVRERVNADLVKLQNRQYSLD